MAREPCRRLAKWRLSGARERGLINAFRHASPWLSIGRRTSSEGLYAPPKGDRLPRPRFRRPACRRNPTNRRSSLEVCRWQQGIKARLVEFANRCSHCQTKRDRATVARLVHRAIQAQGKQFARSVSRAIAEIHATCRNSGRDQVVGDLPDAYRGTTAEYRASSVATCTRALQIECIIEV